MYSCCCSVVFSCSNEMYAKIGWKPSVLARYFNCTLRANGPALFEAKQHRLQKVLAIPKQFRMEGCQKVVLRPLSIEDFDLKIGFIGAGKMAQALSLGFAHSGLVKPHNMVCSDIIAKMMDDISADVGIHITKNNEEVVRSCDIVIVAVKPHCVADALREVAPIIHANHLIVSIAAGVKISTLEQLLPPQTRVVRVMPNMPALVQSGATVFCPGSNAKKEDCELIRRLFSSIGYCTQLPENHFDAVTGLSGSGPAYGFMFIEAMADGGVKMGLPRDVAQQLAAQTLMGAAKMVLETGKHPGQLKDDVCSPGGTTIAAVHQLESSGVRAALISAVETATKKSVLLSNHGQGDEPH